MASATTATRSMHADLHAGMAAPDLPTWVVTAVQACRMAWRFWAGEGQAANEPGAAAEPFQAPVRFRHPHTGQGWDGHGPQPQWLRDAVLNQGYTVEELRRAARG